MRDFVIRYAELDDAKALANLSAETFWDAYHTSEKLEVNFLKNHIAKTFGIRQIEEDILNDLALNLVVSSDAELIGYARLLFESIRAEVSGNRSIEISRVYLRKEFWGCGFGKPLLERCIEEAKNRQCDVIWLSVWQFNQRAIKFYERSGFKKVGTHIFDLAGSEQIDFLMQKRLQTEFKN